jgi:hypothetical protein
MGALAESKAAYSRASELSTKVAAHMDQVPGKRVGLTVVERAARSQDVAEVLTLFRNAKSARQAVLASVILNPPKALQDSLPVF